MWGAPNCDREVVPENRHLFEILSGLLRKNFGHYIAQAAYSAEAVGGGEGMENHTSALGGNLQRTYACELFEGGL